MRKLAPWLMAATLMIVPLTVQAQQRSVAVGVLLGQPTGLSVKVWLDKTSALDVAAAWTFLPQGALYIQADYLYHFFSVFPVKDGELPLYLGVGASATVAGKPTIGIRIPVGIDYLFPHLPLDAFAEVGAGVAVYPATLLLVTGGIGIRYDF